MIRRLLNNSLETALHWQSESFTHPHPFTTKETQTFGWLTNIAPCFPIKASSIKIISEPLEFYMTLLDYCSSAKSRITLASLYFGSGNLEKQLVQSLIANVNFMSGNLQLNILLDFTRGSRSSDNSRTTLQPLLQKNDRNCNISLYHTPALRGLLKKYLPNRFNEVLGLQHMKLYIFDDTLIISGANLSNDYFTNRQDRYFIIKDRQLCDFYCGLVRKVQTFSFKMDKNNNVKLDDEWNYSPHEGNRSRFVESANRLVEGYLSNVKEEQNMHKTEGFDTWIFPLVQMGPLVIEQDALVTEKILSEAPKDSKLNMATGYFNLTEDYMQTLIEKSMAECNILMAHPNANGFLGAKGVAGGIPFAYSLIAHKFKKKVEKHDQSFRINLLEYLKEGWTYHAKGLWYYPPNGKYPCLTLIGSPNFGDRSVQKDLETQLAIVTENKELQKELHVECEKLYQLGLPAETSRAVPRWTNIFVYLFRSYF